MQIKNRGHSVTEPGWKLAAIIIISNKKGTYLSPHENCTRVSPEKHWHWIPGNLPAMQSGVAQKLTIWWAAHGDRVIEGLAPWGGGVIAKLMVEAFVSGPDSN